MQQSNVFSDYGTGSSSSSSSWLNQQDHRWPTFQPVQAVERLLKTSSVSDLEVVGKYKLDAVMREFRENGSDSPYDPDEDDHKLWGKYSELSGMGPSGGFCRQQSWPAPERSPAPPLRRAPPPPPRPAPHAHAHAHRQCFATSTPVFDEPAAPFTPELPLHGEMITEEQARVLRSLPAAVVYALLRSLNPARCNVNASGKRNVLTQECRFCKNNGERESFYRTHVLKDSRGRVACPVLRAFQCVRCGAHGDHAHTLKYCPFSTNEERIKSTAMMRSVRLASGRRRARARAAPRAAHCAPPPPLYEYSACEAPLDPPLYDAPLDPLWAAVEQKLML